MRSGLRRAAGTTVTGAALALALLPVAAAAEPGDFRLSDPAAHTWRWATVERRTAARAAPGRHARMVAALSRWTPERTPEAVPLLARRLVNGRLWIKVRLPVLPNGTTGWMRRGRLGGYITVHSRLVVDRRALTARLERRGRIVFRASIGIGRPDWPTPRGRFMVRNRLTGFEDPVYGPLAFGTTARSATLTDWPGGGFIGIHGTGEPGVLPGRVSHGCIRMRNADIRRLGRTLRVGTPVIVL